MRRSSYHTVQQLAAFMAMFLICLQISAQDTICFRSGGVKAVKLIEIGPAAVRYYSFSNLSGPTYIADKNDIYKIKYANGQTDSFAVKVAPVTETAIPVKRVKTPHKAPKFMVFAGGGLGLGSASLEHGQTRTFYNADLSAVYKNIICTFRYIKSEELQISSGYFWPEFNSLIGPIEHSQETALLFGYSHRTPKFLLSASAGCSLQDNLVRGPNIAVTNADVKYEAIQTRHIVGVPVEAQVIRHWLCFGLGVKVHANFNQVVNTAGILFTMKMGFFGL